MSVIEYPPKPIHKLKRQQLETVCIALEGMRDEAIRQRDDARAKLAAAEADLDIAVMSNWPRRSAMISFPEWLEYTLQNNSLSESLELIKEHLSLPSRLHDALSSLVLELIEVGTKIDAFKTDDPSYAYWLYVDECANHFVSTEEAETWISEFEDEYDYIVHKIENLQGK